MSTKGNKAMYRCWIEEAWNAAVREATDELHATESVNQSGLAGVPSKARDSDTGRVAGTNHYRRSVIVL